MKKFILPAIGIVLGAVGGFAYYHFWGCTNGCPLKSSAPLMTGYGAVLGLVLLQFVGDLFARKKKSATEETVQ